MLEDFDKLSDFKNLYSAHLKTRLCKRHKAEVIRFEVDLGSNLIQLSQLLREGRYLPVKYYHFKVFEPKERDIYALRYPDRVVQRCLCDQVIAPVIEPRLIHDNAACRKGKGTHFSLDRLSSFMRAHYSEFGTQGYFLKCDISKYFQSIDHDVLKGLLLRLPFSNRMQEFLSGLINCYKNTPGRGLPLGNQSSQWFALYYLDQMDRLIKEKLRIKRYVRYMDDFILLHPDKEYLQEAKNQIEKLLTEELRLALNNKTQLVPLRCGIRYLGFSFRLTETGRVIRKVLPSTKKRMKKRMKAIRQGLSSGASPTNEAHATLVSYKGHLRHGNCQGLERKIDQLLGCI